MPPAEHGGLVVAEMAEQPPEALGAAAGPVGDDEDARLDACPPGGLGERFGARQRVPGAALDGRRGEVGLDVEERGTGDVAGEVQLAAAVGLAELPAAIDEAEPGH